MLWFELSDRETHALPLQTILLLQEFHCLSGLLPFVRSAPVGRLCPVGPGRKELGSGFGWRGAKVNAARMSHVAQASRRSESPSSALRSGGFLPPSQ